MEVKFLAPVVLSVVLVGLILGVGIIVHTKMGDQMYQKYDHEQNVTPETLLDVNLDYGNITQVYSVYNATNRVTIPGSNYTINYTAGTFYLLSNDTILGGLHAVTVKYEFKDFGTTARASLMNTIAAEADISSTWLSLIITVIVLAIILTLVIRAFTIRGAR